MTHPRGMHPGATWRKCDFQIHTPRDPQWSGGPHLPGGDDATELSRHAWADAFVAHCSKIGLGAIAITDHHDFCFIEYVRHAIVRAATDGTEGLLLFPGVEVTCNDAVQCLVLFDVNSSPEDWNRLFGGHFQKITAPDRNKATNPQAGLCGKDFEAFVTGIADDSELKRRSIVLPHAGDAAYKSILRQGFHTRFKELPFDGVYLDKPFVELDGVARKKIWGEIEEWGRRRRGILPTGDNRVSTFESLGGNPCWIRLGEATTEAIRQAVLADEARIAYEPPTVPSQRLLRLAVQSSLTGHDFQVSFNDGFTAIIGGRGSGKSAILEYLRYGLGRSALDTAGSEEESRSREKSLVVDTLTGGVVTVDLERDGVIETWTRTGEKRELISATLPDGSVEELTVAAAQQRFRARAFYQKQLSSLVADKSKAHEQITGIAAAETVDQRHRVDQDIASAKRAVLGAFQRLVEYWVAESQHKQSANSVSDLKRRIEALKERLEASGLKPEHQAVLDKAPTYKLIEALTLEAEAGLAGDINRVHAFRDTIPSIDISHWRSLAKHEGVSAMVDALDGAKTQINDALAGIETTLSSLEQTRGQFAGAFLGRKLAFDGQHAAVTTQQEHLRSLIDESSRLVNELQSAEAAERQSAAQLKSLDSAESLLERALGRLAQTIVSRRGILAAAAAQVSAMSSDSLRASVVTESMPAQYVESLTVIFDGHRIRELQTRCEDRARAAINAEPVSEWREAIRATMQLYRHKLQTGSVSIDDSESVATAFQNALLGNLTPQQLVGVYNALDPEKVGAALIATSEDFVTFEYRDGDQFIRFERASEGQQAAALLQLLLNQEAGTLVIDQPEEDLDNRVIMRIVRQLQVTKRKRQLIFATHNANFVVNGDADKVVVLKSGDVSSSPIETASRIGIDVDGAIETSPVRMAITDTMEGGQEAFELRNRKYLFPH